MEIICLKSRQKIPAVDTDADDDIAFCRSCNYSFSFAELLKKSSAQGMGILQVPDGAWYRQTGNGFEIGATTRSWIGFVLVPCLAIWPLLILNFYAKWLKSGTGFSFGFFMVVLILFALPSLLPTSVILMYLAGKVVVSVESGEGRIFTGVGPLGWTRRFKWNSIKRVRKGWTTYQVNGSHQPLIELEREKRVRFGSLLKNERREFMMAVLKKKLSGFKMESSIQ